MATIRRILFFFIFLISNDVLAQYFQQDVKYTIRVTLDDKRHLLNGEETIIYKNNSRDNLSELYFHLWPAAYKDETTPLARQYFDAGDNRMLVAKDREFGDIDSLRFQINGETTEHTLLQDHPDVCRIKLKTPLKPGDSLTVFTPFRVRIPSSKMSRLGHYKQAYYITQWFPKPAVYDKNGWNYFSYLDKGEFYSEFGSFDVYVTLPSNYLIAATGRIADGNREVEWLKSQDSLTRTNRNYLPNDSFPVSSKEMKTIHFTQDSIHDFAWFADKRWHYLEDTLKLQSGKVISVRSYYNSIDSSNWKKANSIIKTSIKMHSDLIGEYPYDAVSAVDVGPADGSGMEYPMITAMTARSSLKYFESTLVHEVGHNWFYGMLGTNERCHGWMDEGVNKYYDIIYNEEKYKNDSSNYYFRFTKLFKNNIKRINKFKMPYENRLLFNYLTNARMNEDQSPDICCENFNLKKYSQDLYHKPALSLRHLHNYLGDSLFNSCMQEYFSEWKFKHPAPEDMKAVFEKKSGKNLAWCFDDLLRSTKKLDYSVSKLSEENGKRFVTIKNTKDIVAPFEINAISKDKNTSFWSEGFKGKQKIEIKDSTFTSLKIDANGMMPELYAGNNDIDTKGMFRKCGKVKFIFATAKEDPDHTQIFYSPVAGWNLYNGLMMGAVFHNISFLEKKFEYRLMPMYAVKSYNLTGGGDLAYHFYPNGKIYRITLRSGISHYGFNDDVYYAPNDDVVDNGTLSFTKIDNRIIFSIRAKEENKNIRNELTIRHIFINRGIPYHYNYTLNESENINYFQAEYSKKNLNPLDQGLRKITVTGNNTFIQVGGEYKQFFTYGTPKKGFRARIYAGYLHVSGTVPAGVDYRMNLSGKSGLDDYLFDDVFLGRSEDNTEFLGMQFKEDYAGFKSPTSFYRLAQEWMGGININTTLPGLIPFRLFANVGSFDNHDIADYHGSISWEFGVDLPVIKDVFIISLPFAYSGDIKYALAPEQQDLSGLELLRFELHLNLLNPLDYIKNFYR